jgi:hypothetical protein
MRRRPLFTVFGIAVVLLAASFSQKLCGQEDKLAAVFVNGRALADVTCSERLKKPSRIEVKSPGEITQLGLTVTPEEGLIEVSRSVAFPVTVTYKGKEISEDRFAFTRKIKWHTVGLKDERVVLRFKFGARRKFLSSIDGLIVPLAVKIVLAPFHFLFAPTHTIEIREQEQ